MLNKRFGNIKGAVSDLHRDVTTRRCLTSYERVEDIVRECATIKTDLDRADTMMDDHKVEFEKRWQQEQLRIKTEQAVFNDQVFSFCLIIKANFDILLRSSNPPCTAQTQLSDNYG